MLAMLMVPRFLKIFEHFKYKFDSMQRSCAKILIGKRGRVEQENIWLPVMEFGPYQSVCHDHEPNIFPSIDVIADNKLQINTCIV